jgi:hypothetical protein
MRAPSCTSCMRRTHRLSMRQFDLQGRTAEVGRGGQINHGKVVTLSYSRISGARARRLSLTGPPKLAASSSGSDASRGRVSSHASMRKLNGRPYRQRPGWFPRHGHHRPVRLPALFYIDSGPGCEWSFCIIGQRMTL